MKEVTRPRRLFVSGGSRLSANAALLWYELGILLARQDGIVVITGGLNGRKDAPGAKTADRAIVDGFRAGLAQRAQPSYERIETYLPDPKMESENLVRFEFGRVHVLTNRSNQARRFRMVHSSDLVISIEGDKGTRSVLDVALAIERPVLPVPCGGGSSEKVWYEEGDGICARFQLTQVEREEFEKTPLNSLTETQIRQFANVICQCLLRGFTSNCFVIMPFKPEFNDVYTGAIMPALEAHGFAPFRTDWDMASGNIVETIRDGLRHCYLAIADITGSRSNVMYELGMAHAYQKDVILICQLNRRGSIKNVPFDLATERILFYESDLSSLCERLKHDISLISGRVAVGESQ